MINMSIYIRVHTLYHNLLIVSRSFESSHRLALKARAYVYGQILEHLRYKLSIWPGPNHSGKLNVNFMPEFSLKLLFGISLFKPATFVYKQELEFAVVFSGDFH